MRRALLLSIMVVGIALVAWSGWQNWLARRSIIQTQKEQQVELIPNTQSPIPDDSATGESPLKGKSAPAFTLGTAAKTGLAKFSVKLSKANLAAALADDGLTATYTPKQALNLRVTVLFNGIGYQKYQKVLYAPAKNGKSGTAKFAK